MRIVPQLAPVSYSPFPALPAPRIAGLLPARTGQASTPPIIVDRPREPRQSRLDRQRAIWAAQDAELEAFLQGARERLSALYAEITQNAAARPAHPTLREIAS
jgi:hypothetical protein